MLLACSACFLYKTQDHEPRSGSTHKGLGPPPSIKKCPGRDRLKPEFMEAPFPPMAPAASGCQRPASTVAVVSIPVSLSVLCPFLSTRITQWSYILSTSLELLHINWLFKIPCEIVTFITYLRLVSIIDSSFTVFSLVFYVL